MGGLDRVNSYAKIYLAMFGVFKWSEAPAVPPELMFLPPTFYFNLYEISSWSRAMLVPLAIIWAHKPVCPLPEHARIDELFLYPRQKEHHLNGTRHWNLGHLFSSCNELAKLHEFVPLKPWRKTALKQAEEWMLERIVPGGLGAIFPSMLNSIIALRVLGYPKTHPKVQLAVNELEGLICPDEVMLRFQPCLSPVWDTGLTTFALQRSGLPGTHPAMGKAVDWLLSKECRRKGDWHRKTPDAPASGWYFEFHNEFYPDLDDTAMVLLAISGSKDWADGRAKQALKRGHDWLLAMQSDDGGWGAFDRNNNKMVFTKVPFADHNALLDPSTSDVTGRVLEYLGQVGWNRSSPVVARAIEFIKKDQEPDGCWYGRWGVNYVYGTSQVLRGLAAIGEDMRQPYAQRAADWLISCQNADGGWGESCDSYDDPTLKGQGESTPSQTAWGILGLLAAGKTDHPAVERAVAHLIRTQRLEGGWDERYYTGTGFPKVYYLEYTMYRHYFPLMALSQYREKRKQ
jgi:squalene-hopene/tetraprenyl-beta-curcumene cyclase